MRKNLQKDYLFPDMCAIIMMYDYALCATREK